MSPADADNPTSNHHHRSADDSVVWEPAEKSLKVSRRCSDTIIMIRYYEVMIACENDEKLVIIGTGQMSSSPKSKWLQKALKNARNNCAPYPGMVHFIARRPASVGNGNYNYYKEKLKVSR